MTNFASEIRSKEVAALMTPDVVAMQVELFGTGSGQRVQIPHVVVWQMLRALRQVKDLEGFRLWLVGSRVDGKTSSSDVDVVIAPTERAGANAAAIERALWRCRKHGLTWGQPACMVDACFRDAGPTLSTCPLERDAVLKSVMLLSPRVLLEIAVGKLTDYRTFGSLCIEFTRCAEGTTYYSKLPRKAFDGKQSAYLRPAVEVP